MPPSTTTTPLNLPGALRIWMQTSAPRLTITMADDAYDYNLSPALDPDDLFSALLTHSTTLTPILHFPTHTPTLERHLLSSLTSLIHSFNNIELAGCPLPTTLSLSHPILLGLPSPTPPSAPNSKSPTTPTPSPTS